MSNHVASDTPTVRMGRAALSMEDYATATRPGPRGRAWLAEVRSRLRSADRIDPAVDVDRVT
jgi:hypothetical protein